MITQRNKPAGEQICSAPRPYVRLGPGPPEGPDFAGPCYGAVFFLASSIISGIFSRIFR